MLDFFHNPSNFKGDVQIYTGDDSVQPTWRVWNKPRGVSMVAIYAVGKGGNGGDGAVGANSAAAGGGGGASGSQCFVCVPAIFIPDTLYVVTYISASAVTATPTGSFVASNSLVYATAGNNGGNASGATAGTAGAVGTSPSIATQVLSGLGIGQFTAGQAGIAGGIAVAGTNLTIPTTGLTITGGTGGGGVPAAAASGTSGGNISASGIFQQLSGGGVQATATSPGNPGSNGLVCAYRGLEFSIGGTGGGSSHGSATGAGLFGGNGGDGGIGSGGGGGGGCLTGGVAGKGGKGGPGQVVILAW